MNTRIPHDLGGIAAGAIVALAACSNPAGPAPMETPTDRVASPSSRYLPLSVGAKWTYHATDPLSGASGETYSTIEALEDVGGSKAGIMAYRVRSSTLTGSTVNWQQDLNMSVVRQREQFFDLGGSMQTDYVFQPDRLRLDESPEHLVVGATWTENHGANFDDLVNRIQKPVTFTAVWTVEAVDESVTVPAGTFSCLRVRRVQTGFASSDETHYFARHIGQVKQTGPEPKDLTSYSIPAAN
jgi:hypothetical protein